MLEREFQPVTQRVLRVLRGISRHDYGFSLSREQEKMGKELAPRRVSSFASSEEEKTEEQGGKEWNTVNRCSDRKRRAGS